MARGRRAGRFFEIHDAWEVYEPVGFADVREAIMMPDPERLLTDYRRELERFIGAEVQTRAAPLREQLARSPDDPRTLNSLGVLYARYGLLDEAAAEFQKALQGGEVASILLNLGNIAYLKDDMGSALDWYRRALKKAPDSAAALLGVAKASYELADYEGAEEALAVLRDKNPQTAAQFSYLGTGGQGRAAEAGKREINEWSDI